MGVKGARVLRGNTKSRNERDGMLLSALFSILFLGDDRAIAAHELFAFVAVDA